MIMKIPKIDKGVLPDVPPIRKMKYPWLQLAVGDSFECDLSLELAKGAATKASSRYDRTFQAGTSSGKVRIWRWQ
jgi:hypothetical protein